MTAAARLEPDRDQIEIFVDAVLRHRGTGGFLSLRSFHENDDSKKPARISGISVRGNFRYLIDAAVDDARRAAQSFRAAVFCPPLCVFSNKDHAGEADVLAGLVLSVECDRGAHDARRQLEDLLGPATVVVRSGGQWIDEDGEVHDRLHLHWRLAEAARGKDDLAALKAARESAARLVGADGSNNPVCHPIRWPGSWHRKKEPRLCSILAVEPDREIALAAAVAALPPPPNIPITAPEVWRSFVNEPVEGSSRSRAIARLYGLMVRKYIDAIVAIDICRMFNALRCKPPIDDYDLVQIVDDIARREADRREAL